MHIPTIDREDATNLFLQLLDPTPPQQSILRLLGDAKMGKTHLLTKVFPALVPENAARFAVHDLHNPQITIIDHLLHTCSQIGDNHFSAFYQEHTAWTDRPKIQVSGLLAMFSSITVRIRSREDDADHMIQRLIRCFVDDLRQLDDLPVVLIFDNADAAAQATWTWLMDTLLVQLQVLSHVRIVVGGRALPEASGSYARRCCSYELKPVQEESAYIEYCREVRASLVEQSIRDFAKASDYVPGRFAETVNLYFLPRGSPNG